MTQNVSQSSSRVVANGKSLSDDIEQSASKMASAGNTAFVGTGAASLVRRQFLRHAGCGVLVGAAGLANMATWANWNDSFGISAAVAQDAVPSSTDQPPQIVPRPPWELLERDSAKHGAVFALDHKYCMVVSGTPEQMGAAHGRLLRWFVHRLVERVVYGLNAAEAVSGGSWLLDTLAEVERRTLPHIPERFMAECDAMSQAAGIAVRDGRYANFFPERFHCSGFAVRGRASVDGRILHARVLDYMRDIALQRYAAVQIFVPDGYIPWMSLGYGGFIGTVTAMNAEGVAVGEMGGRGEGAWDGVPMSLLLRDLMERAHTTDEAFEILRSTPRTCEYYYVISDHRGTICGVKATPEHIERLEPGAQHPELPTVPPDTVLMSAGDRAKELSRRLHEHYGKIDVPAMIEIMRRPVAMESNLHNAVFAPQSQEMWFANAGRTTPACDESYCHCCLPEMLDLHRRTMNTPMATPQ